MKQKKPKNDRALRFYNQVLGLDHLHYGIWNEDDELTIANLKIAQQRYEDLIVDAIPDGVTTILDVGCGTGELSKRLANAGYQVEGLSPDINQKDLYSIKTNGRPFHFYRFEEFKPTLRYDCIIMSESGQYIPIEMLFTTAALVLNPGGFLINIDYFVLDNADGVLGKSGHNLNRYISEADNNNFTMIIDNDITAKIVKTLDFSKQLVERGFIAFDIATEKFRYKHPIITKIINYLIRRKKQKINDEMILLNSKKFTEVKKYILFMFQFQNKT
ncbi:MAG: methyltransferase domain-containing protein [Gammaproteobacteria bacterium]|nr:methyltransferase domain-containing protein [Gammaproteobacteria bacterium]